MYSRLYWLYTQILLVDPPTRFGEIILLGLDLHMYYRLGAARTSVRESSELYARIAGRMNGLLDDGCGTQRATREGCLEARDHARLCV